MNTDDGCFVPGCNKPAETGCYGACFEHRRRELLAASNYADQHPETQPPNTPDDRKAA